MFVIDFSPHLAKKRYPVRNVRISPDSGTLAATFGEEGNATEVAWWNLAREELIAVQSLQPTPNAHDPEPAFLPDITRCAALWHDDFADQDFAVLVGPSVSLLEGATLPSRVLQGRQLFASLRSR